MCQRPGCTQPLNTGTKYCSRRCALLVKRLKPGPKTPPKPKAKTSRAGVVGAEWERARARVKADTIRLGLPCWICTRPIDWTAAPRTPLSFSVDHVDPRSKGGAHFVITNLRPAHYGCNSSRGNGTRRPRKATARAATTTTDRW